MGLIYPDFYRKLFEHFGPQGWWPGDTKIEIVIGAILTQNTAWSNVVKALKNLEAAGSISLEFIRKSDKETLASIIKPTGYFNQKADRLKGFVDFLDDNYQGDLDGLLSLDLPELRNVLLSVKGIGPETADDIILYAAEKPVFVIDAYTKRIFSRHMICNTDIKYNDLQDIIEEQVPKNTAVYKEYHGLLVVLAKKYCFKNDPDCLSCPLRDYERKI